MAQSNEPLEQEAESFEGAVAGLSLPEVIEQSGANHFSGCLTVRYGGSVGLIFFRDGEIVHAEQGVKSGADAFYDILEWHGATRFSLEANVTSTRRTLQSRAVDLLAEAQRVLQERGAGAASGSPAEGDAAAASKRSAAASLLDKLKRIPGVAYVVLMAKDGTCVEDSSFQAESLAGQAAYLSMVANHLGTIFRAGPVHSAAVHGSSQHMLLLASKNYYLSVLIQGEAEVRVVEAEVRKALTAGR